MFSDDRLVQGNQNVKVPAHLNFAKYMLEKLRSYGDKVALENVTTGEKLTYRQMVQYAVDLSAGLSELGVGRGDVVALGSEKRNMFVPTALAIIFAGATYTPYDLKSGRGVLKHKISITQPKYFICSRLFWETYGDVLEDFESVKCYLSLDEAKSPVITIKSLISKHHDVSKFEPGHVHGQKDTAFILYSSGTTGMPKGVQLTHLNCILNSLPDDFKDEELKTAFLAGEWYHNYDTFMTYKFFTLGRKIVYMNDITHESLLECLEKHKVNIALIIPSMISWLSKTDPNLHYNLSSLKVLYARSSPLHLKTMQKVKQRFPSIQKVLQGYGMTEAGELTSENWGAKGPRPGSVGSASPGIILKIVDPITNETLGPNERGEICLTGPVFMKGYINVDPSTYMDEDGYFKTGDLGYYDEDGYFYIIDRLKEIIKYDGYQVPPLELETILLLHPKVREVGVVGKPAGVLGEAPAAFVVKQPGTIVTETELLNYVANEVPPYMRLRGGVRFIEHIPRNPRGKILRRRLREMLEVESA